LEEERRLAYVAITRAKRQLVITTARERLLYGVTQRNKVSRFVKEIPPEFISVEQNRVKTVSSAEKPAVTPAKPAVKSATAQVFSDGDRVLHKVFGEGTVLAGERMGNDTLLEIAFDRVGTKKIMANFAGIAKI